MLEQRLAYESYLLRLWQVRHNGKLVWRASLESTRTGARENFADLAQAFDFLRGALHAPEHHRRVKTKNIKHRREK